MFLLDTNVVSELRKSSRGKADAGVVAWAAATPAESMFLSVISLYELDFGVLQMERRDPLQGSALRLWLDGHVMPFFRNRLLAFDEPVARRCARLQMPDKMPMADAILAATALIHGLTVVTRNSADFRQAGVALINPWSFQPPSQPPSGPPIAPSGGT